MRKVALQPLAPAATPEAKLKWAVDAIQQIGRASHLADDVIAARQEKWIGADAMTARVSSGAAAGTFDSGSVDVTIPVLDFDAAIQEYAHFNWAPPKRWNAGTVTFIPYWTNASGLTTETVKWTLAARAFSNDDALNAAFGTAQGSTDTWLAQGDVHVGPESAAITIAGSPADGDLVVFELSRDVAVDTLTGDARLIGIKLIWTANAESDT